MKEVIFKQQNTININELNDTHFIGVEFDKQPNKKGFLAKVSKNEWIIIYLESNNYDAKLKCDSIKSLLDALGSKTGVFVFDNAQEFKTWLL